MASSGMAGSSRCTLKRAAEEAGALPPMGAHLDPAWVVTLLRHLQTAPRPSLKSVYHSLRPSTPPRRCLQPWERSHWATRIRALVPASRAWHPFTTRAHKDKHPTSARDLTAAAHRCAATPTSALAPSTTSTQATTCEETAVSHPPSSIPRALLEDQASTLQLASRRRTCSCLRARLCRSRRLLRRSDRRERDHGRRAGRWPHPVQHP